MQRLPESTDYLRTWYHMVQGYDVGYYGYGWSEAYGLDIFHEFKAKGGCFDSTLGVRYREAILRPGLLGINLFFYFIRI